MFNPKSVTFYQFLSAFCSISLFTAVRATHVYTQPDRPGGGCRRPEGGRGGGGGGGRDSEPAETRGRAAQQCSTVCRVTAGGPDLVVAAGAPNPPRVGAALLAGAPKLKPPAAGADLAGGADSVKPAARCTVHKVVG